MVRIDGADSSYEEASNSQESLSSGGVSIAVAYRSPEGPLRRGPKYYTLSDQ